MLHWQDIINPPNISMVASIAGSTFTGLIFHNAQLRASYYLKYASSDDNKITLSLNVNNPTLKPLILTEFKILKPDILIREGDWKQGRMEPSEYGKKLDLNEREISPGQLNYSISFHVPISDSFFEHTTHIKAQLIFAGSNFLKPYKQVKIHSVIPQLPRYNNIQASTA